MKKLISFTLLLSASLFMMLSCGDKEEPVPKSTATDILTFTIEFQTGTATIDVGNHTVAVEVTNGTDLTALTPTFTLSALATSSPVSGTEGDYSNAVTITVTAEDGTTTQGWTVTVTEAAPGLSSATDILTFSFPEQTGIVGDGTNHTIDVEVVNGTNLTALTPTFSLSAGATSVPATGTSGDYSNPVTITVTAEDGKTVQDWVVTVTEASVSTATDILTFSFAEQSGDAVINATNHTVDVDVVNGTALTALTPTFTLSPGATSAPATGTSGDYSSALIITVTAGDGTTTQDWTVTVTEAAASDPTTVIFGDGGTKATAITNLVVNGVTYDVEIVLSYAAAIYDVYPGTYTFNTSSKANDAIEAINIALNDAGATAVNQMGGTFNYEKYRIGYQGIIGPGSLEYCEFVVGDYDTSWTNLGGENALYNDSQSNWTWAVFTEK